MLTKLIKFDGDVLDTLKSMDWSEDGLLGKMGQMDRKLYEKVNKALTAMGGKWNKKAGGHVFSNDPRPQVEGLIDTGSITVKRDGFFETPAALVEHMIQLANIHPGDLVLEPSAGLGAIAVQLRDAGVSVVCVENNEQRARALWDLGFQTGCKDFLLVNPDLEKYQAVVMNPPFEELQDIDHVRHAYKFLDEGGTLVSVMSAGAFFRTDKKPRDFREWLVSLDYDYEELPAGTFKESGTNVNTRLIVIRKGDPS